MTRAAAVVLAAGAASRFGADKLAAALLDRPVVRHVVDAAAEAGLDPIVVVLPLAGGLARLVERTGVHLVRNAAPERGLASSVQLAFAELDRIAPPEVGAAVVLPADQPLVRPAVIRDLVAAEDPHAFLVPRYEDDDNPNPVLVRRVAWRVAAELEGDRGFGPYLDRSPELVGRIPVAGTNPDVDTPTDLALAAWAARVEANREQVERVREEPESSDFYAPVSAVFRADPDRTGDRILDALAALAQPGETWLDIGGGAGRYALPLARRVRQVDVVDPSASMLDALAQDAAAHGIGNARGFRGRWPLADADWPAELPRSHAVTLIANVGYDIARIGPFLDAMEQATSRLCVAVLARRNPAWLAEPFWPPIHGQRRIRLPAAPEFVALLEARGRRPDTTLVTHPFRAYPTRDALHAWVRQQLFVAAGGESDRRLHALVEKAIVEVEGGLRFRHDEPVPVAVITWPPR